MDLNIIRTRITITHVSFRNLHLRRLTNFLHVLDRFLSGLSIRLVGESLVHPKQTRKVEEVNN